MNAFLLDFGYMIAQDALTYSPTVMAQDALTSGPTVKSALLNLLDLSNSISLLID